MVGPSMQDAEKVASVREALPAVAAGIYMNAPVAGPLPAESAAAMAEILDWEVRTGRAHRDRSADVEARVDEARAAVAAILTADLDNVIVVNGIDDALARAIRTIDWRPGDRLAVVADPATAPIQALLPVGVEVVPPDVTDRVRLLALPLVRATTGERMPVEGLVRGAQAHGIKTLVEASLAVGAVPIDLAALGAELLVARSEAWLLGPVGLAIIAATAVAGTPPIAVAGNPPAAGFHLPSVVAFARGCGWLSMYVGLPWIHERGAALTDLAARRLSAIDGVDLLTPPARATTLAFRIRGWSAGEALDELGSRIFLLAGTSPTADAIRIGLGFWNTDDEIERLAVGVGVLAAHTPATLPPRRLTILGHDR